MKSYLWLEIRNVSDFTLYAISMQVINLWQCGTQVVISDHAVKLSDCDWNTFLSLVQADSCNFAKAKEVYNLDKNDNHFKKWAFDI